MRSWPMPSFWLLLGANERITLTMYLHVRDGRGKSREGLVLAVGKDRIRVAFRGNRDVDELSRSFGQWLNEAGELVEFEVIVSSCVASVFAELFAVTSTGRTG